VTQFFRARAWWRLDSAGGSALHVARSVVSLLDAAAYTRELPDDDPYIDALSAAGCFAGGVFDPGPLGWIIVRDWQLSDESTAGPADLLAALARSAPEAPEAPAARTDRSGPTGPTVRPGQERGNRRRRGRKSPGTQWAHGVWTGPGWHPPRSTSPGRQPAPAPTRSACPARPAPRAKRRRACPIRRAIPTPGP
jgi:hypothetical protein